MRLWGVAALRVARAILTALKGVFAPLGITTARFEYNALALERELGVSAPVLAIFQGVCRVRNCVLCHVRRRKAIVALNGGGVAGWRASWRLGWRA